MSVAPESQVDPTQDTPQSTPDEPVGEPTTAPAEEPTVPSEPAEAEPVHETIGDGEANPDEETTPAPAPTPRPTPKPGAVPSPKMLASIKPAAVVPAVPTALPDPVESMKFGRVDEATGMVFVTTDEGEQEVGQHPEGKVDEALAFFARKFDEVFAQAELLKKRLENTEVPAGEAAEALKRLRNQVKESNLVGDLKKLATEVTAVAAIVSEKSRREQAEREVLRAKAREEREALVVEAEGIASQPPARTQWKNSGARMRELLDEWKRHQKEGVRLDKESENALWARFSAARNGFDRARRAWFAELDQQHGQAKATKERLVERAEALSSSTDWRSTPGEYRRLMDEWRGAGRAAKADDDALWERFRAAQQTFFSAKDEVVAAEEASYADNLKVKEEILVEAESLLPITDLEAAKSRLRGIQERWDAAGKVPRADIGRVEGRMKAVEQAVRDAEDKKWKKSNPELVARASSMVEQLSVLVTKCEQELEEAKASGNAKKIAEAEKALTARQQWLEQAQASLDEAEG